jgi:ParB/RepB/Spo0J family partition protein
MDLAHVDIKLIHPPKFMLRPVRTASIEYAEMLDSIRDNGVLQPILVRRLDNGEYEVVEGNWRFTCCTQLRMETIPCLIRDMSDDQVKVTQLVANGIRPETSPVEFSERLAQFLHNNPDMTVPMMAVLIRKSPQWIRNILRLTKLRAEYSLMVRRGEIPLTSACILARLPPEYQDTLIQKAQTLTTKEFNKLAHSELKRLREASRNAYINNHPVNQPKPVPNLRRFVELRSEFERPTAAGPTLLKMAAKTAMDGWSSCMAWIMHMDPDSLVDQEKMVEDRRNVELRAVERRRKERRALQKLREKTGETNITHLEFEE